MKNCTYTAQGFLNCPVDNKTQTPQHYRTVGFDRDAQAGVFIEPFQQQQTSENFGVAKTIQVPAWATDPQGQFASQCKDCKMSACDGSRCTLSCKCSRCENGKIISANTQGFVPMPGSKNSTNAIQYYCEGKTYSKNECTADQLAKLQCQAAKTTAETTAETSAENTKETLYQRFTNSPYNMAQ